MSGRDQRTRVVGALLLGFLLVACSSTGGRPETRVAPAFLPGPGSRSNDPATVPSVVGEKRTSSSFDAAVEAHVFLGVNRTREEEGRRTLTMRQDLRTVARGHARDMAERGYFSHRSPSGDGPGERAVRAGIRYGAFAENLARVRNARDPATLAIRGWLESAGHRRNLLDERGAGYRFTGVGAARAADGSLYIAQVFLR